MNRVLSDVLAAQNPWVLVVGNETGLAKRLKAQNINSFVVETPCEAIELLREIIYSGSFCDGLLVDYTPPDAATFKILEDFRDEFWDVPLALMMGFENMSPDIWSWSRHIPIFQKPLQMTELESWIHDRRKSA